jgi:hypothetical protein
MSVALNMYNIKFVFLSVYSVVTLKTLFNESAAHCHESVFTL